MRHLFAGFVIGLVTLVSAGGSALAQDATPAPLGAEHCTVDPIEPESYIAAIQASVPPLAQSAFPTGEPADDATGAAVTDTIEQSIACTNIGDLGRLLAVIDPAYAPTLLGVPLSEVPDAVRAAAAASNAPGPATPLVDDLDQGGLVSTLYGVSDVLILPDGQVSAVATLAREGFPTPKVTIYLHMDETLGRYIITNYTFQSAMPVATPAA